MPRTISKTVIANPHPGHDVSETDPTNYSEVSLVEILFSLPLQFLLFVSTHALSAFSLSSSRRRRCPFTPNVREDGAERSKRGDSEDSPYMRAESTCRRCLVSA